MSPDQELRLRIDFGRVVPGVLILISGLLVLVVLALVAVVAFLFSFTAGAGAVLGAVPTLMLVPAALVASGLLIILSGVSWWGRGGGGWFSGTAEARASEDRIRVSGRIGEVFGIAVSLIIFFFLYENQLRGVAFFTPSFGGLESILFYAPLFTGMALSLARALYGRRNGLRPFDAVNALFLAFAAFWLLSVFPFDFAHFADMFPASIQFIFAWLPNWVGRVLFALAGVGSLVNFAYTAVLYTSVRNRIWVATRRPLGI